MKKYKLIIPALLVLPMLTGCGTLGISKAKYSDSSQPSASAATKKNNNSNKNAGPSSREKVDEVTVETYTPADIEEGSVRGSWAIIEVNGKKPVSEEAPYLIFEKNDPTAGGKINRLYGCNGCNIINAAYTFNPSDHTISFSNAAATMRMCAPGVTDSEINKALNDTRFYSWEKKDSQFYIYLKNSSHNTVLTLMHQSFDFLEGTWRVVEMNGVEVKNPDMKLIFDVASGRLHGNTGCNILNASLEANPESVNTISIQNILTTRMACENPRTESDLIIALEEAYTAKPIGKSEAELLNSSGEPILRLVRIAE